jgi:hypothetical protein
LKLVGFNLGKMGRNAYKNCYHDRCCTGGHGIVFCCVLPLIKSLLVQTALKQMAVGMGVYDPPVLVNPVPDAPGQYTDRPCNAKGGPLDCPFGNPEYLYGVRPGGGWACHDYQDQQRLLGNGLDRDLPDLYPVPDYGGDELPPRVHKPCPKRGLCK